MSSPSPHSPEAVLEHLDWVRGLARRLCADACMADDVTQEVVIAAVRQQPPRGLSLRRWLGSIVRNRSRQTLREETRRRGYEGQMDPGTDVPATADFVEKLAVQRRVVDAVLALQEPYRSTLLLRYYEDQSPARIARLTGVPVATVKTRLRRSLAQLRRDMDSEFGSDGRSWLLALIPILPPSSALRALGSGVLFMSIKPLIATLIILVTTVAIYAPWEPGQPASPGTAAAAQPQAEVELLVPVVDPVSIRPESTRERRSQVAVASPVEEAKLPASTAPMLDVLARVFDLESNPVAGVELLLRSSSATRDGQEQEAGQVLGTTDREGRLRIDLPKEGGVLFVDSETYQTVVEGAVIPMGESATPTVIVARPRRLSGRVVNANGEPIPDAQLAYTSNSNLRTYLDVPVDRQSRPTWSRTADATGYFVFESVPELPGSALTAQRAGFLSRWIDLPDLGDAEIEVVLTELSNKANVLFGQVFDPYGRTVEAAQVSFGQLAVKTDGEGVFQLDLIEAPEHPVVRAVKAGYLPAQYALEEDAQWPFPLRLVLGSAPLEISGKVLDENATPIAGLRIEPFDATEFGWVSTGTPANPSLMGMTVENLLAGTPNPEPVVTDERGNFHLRGLLDRNYRLQLENPGTLQVVLSAPIAAGSAGVEIVLPGAGELTAVAGRVTDTEGQPLTGVNVFTSRDIDAQSLGADQGTSINGPTQQTDEAGSFRFRALIAKGLQITVVPDNRYATKRLTLDDFEDPTAIELELTRNASLRVDLGSQPNLADAFELHRPDGEQESMLISEGLSSFWVKQGWFSEGRSGLYIVPEGEFSLVLFLNGQEVTRAELNLTDGETREVNF